MLGDWSCRIVGLSNRQVVLLSDCRVVLLSNCLRKLTSTTDYLTNRLPDYPTNRPMTVTELPAGGAGDGLVGEGVGAANGRFQRLPLR